jgi:hypothetical protein
MFDKNGTIGGWVGEWMDGLGVLMDVKAILRIANNTKNHECFLKNQLMS